MTTEISSSTHSGQEATPADTPAAPQVSIGMPVYNGEPFIREALDSLLAQTFTDFELIISDNGSTDGTEAICREYAAKDARIRYVRQAENRGVMANFQFVLDEAVGEYFMWAAADDRRHAKFIELTKCVLDSEPAVGLVFSGMETKDLLSTGAGVSSTTGFVTSKRKSIKALFRLAHPCSTLIYGLHRRQVLKSIPMGSYDYSDIFMGLWYELNSAVRIVPIRLFTIGTVGARLPYSLTGKFIDPRRYYSEVRKLFNAELSLLSSRLLGFLNWYLIRKTTRQHNQLIKLSKLGQHESGS